ncbi:MAG: hypothetical protein LC111_10950 [Bacteroidia bacterium]|nr:hypothetical protein [Bacteroidia bacterium]
MPLPQRWVEHLFAKLSVRYGVAFLRQYGDADPALVRADWAEVLDGTSGTSLSYALRYLPVSPPNAIAFRDLCRRAPAPEAPRITHDVPPPDPARVQAIVGELGKPSASAHLSPAQQCAANILRIAADRGGRLSRPQREQLMAMLPMLTPQQRAEVARLMPGATTTATEIHEEPRNAA